MKRLPSRLVALAAAVAIVISCESGSSTNPMVGGTGTSGNTAPTPSSPGAPTIVLDSPKVNAQINVGDSILVVMTLHDDKSVRTSTVRGLAYKGSAALGTLSSSERYTAVAVPVAGTFRNNLLDTTVRRYLQPANLADTTIDSLVIVATVTDDGGKADTARATVQFYAGPKVSLLVPNAGDSIPAGVGVSVTAKSQHMDGMSQVDIRVHGEANWPTKLDTTITTKYTGAPREVTTTSLARIPLNAPTKGRVTISARGVDVHGQLGNSAALVVFVRALNSANPRVTQSVSPRSELGDTVQVTATGDGIRAIGYVARDSVGNIVRRDSVVLSQPYAGNAVRAIVLDSVPTIFQGKKVAITGFAVDQSNRTGYAVRSSQLNPEGTLAAALADSTLIVYGRTYPMLRNGVVGDIVVDPVRGSAIVSNPSFNRLEVWQNSARGFDSLGVAVGSLPWGLFISNNPDTLLVANSGGTNISRVFIGTSNVRNIKEDLGHRILTRGTYLFVVNEVRDLVNNRVTLNAGSPIIFSDRPQYIGQIKSGEVFYSTRPTSEAPAGTLRYLDPSQAVPDSRAIVLFKSAADQSNYVVVNADSLFVRHAIGPAASTFPDTLILFDHPPGTTLPSDYVISTTGVGAAVAAMRAKNGSDVSYVQGVDLSGVAGTDTTYVAVSGDRRWLAFGEGHTAGAGMIFMAGPNFFSPPITQVDLTSNAAEHVNGLALDSTGSTLAGHGQESFLAAVESPFHLRLQGKYQSSSPGAGIVFHPRANGITSPEASRVVFVSTDNYTVEIVDIAYYINRGRLDLKNNLYGPLRASLPLPGDPADIVLKLFGVTSAGMVVIDLRAGDILPVP